MTKFFVAFLLTFCLTVDLLLAGDFWDEKKFTEWTPAQVVKILNDSPWARSYAIPLSSRGGGGAPAGGSSGGGGGGGGKRGGGGGGSVARGGVPEVIIRWHSAMPVRQALIRARYGEQAATSPEAAKMLARQETAYTIGIANVPSWLVIQAKDQLKSGAQLRIKDHPAVQAVEVNADAKTAAVNVFLVFPKEQQGGHVITVDDDEVEVCLKLGSAEIKRKFKLKDMVFNGKLEL